jgi:DNA-binding response OmpR family regulator
MPRRILIVEDERHIAEGLRLNMEGEGYEAVVAYDGQTALDMIRKGGIDLVILDLMLPVVDGFTVLSKIRDEGNRVPVLILTARSEEDDRVRGLALGGDDYLTKPFNLRELLLRIRGIFRRQIWYASEPRVGDEIRIGDGRVNFRTYQGESRGGTFTLSQKECMILRLLAENEGKVVSRDQILDAVWGYESFPTSRTVDNFIVRLRKRFEKDPANPVHIHTLRGVGYRFTREPETE